MKYLWAYLKQNGLANFCAHGLDHLCNTARHKLKPMQQRAALITAFRKQAELAL
jgi:hypothetical protein